MPLSGPPLDGPVSLHDILKTGLATKPDADALVSRRQRWSWRRLDETSTRLAASYLALGLAPGERVASLMPNRTELLVHYIACMKCGLVAMPLNYRYMAPEIDHALSVGEPRILLTHDERRDDLAKSKLAGNLPLGQVSYDDGGGTSNPTFKSLADATPARDIIPPKPGDPAIIFFTSGSTGKPKGVCLGLFGGTTPLIATYLVARTSDDFAPAYYLMAVTLISFVALLGLRETAREPLR